jgi:hypothetical protein
MGKLSIKFTSKTSVSVVVLSKISETKKPLNLRAVRKSKNLIWFLVQGKNSLRVSYSNSLNQALLEAVERLVQLICLRIHFNNQTLFASFQCAFLIALRCTSIEMLASDEV